MSMQNNASIPALCERCQGSGLEVGKCENGKLDKIYITCTHCQGAKVRHVRGKLCVSSDIAKEACVSKVIENNTQEKNLEV